MVDCVFNVGELLHLNWGRGSVLAVAIVGRVIVGNTDFKFSVLTVTLLKVISDRVLISLSKHTERVLQHRD